MVLTLPAWYLPHLNHQRPQVGSKGGMLSQQASEEHGTAGLGDFYLDLLCASSTVLGALNQGCLWAKSYLFGPTLYIFKGCGNKRYHGIDCMWPENRVASFGK